MLTAAVAATCVCVEHIQHFTVHAFTRQHLTARRTSRRADVPRLACSVLGACFVHMCVLRLKRERRLYESGANLILSVYRVSHIYMSHVTQRYAPTTSFISGERELR